MASSFMLPHRNIIKGIPGSLRGGSMVKGTGYSYKAPGFGCQHLHGSEPFVTLLTRDLMPSLASVGTRNICDTLTYRQNSHTHKNKLGVHRKAETDGSLCV